MVHRDRVCVRVLVPLRRRGGHLPLRVVRADTRPEGSFLECLERLNPDANLAKRSELKSL